jgi:sulfide:quinone oxidoreductase
VTSVLILGAGFGGLELSTRLAGAGGLDVTLIDQSDSFYFGFSKLDVLIGRKSTADIRMEYANLAAPGVEFRQETVTAIDPSSRRVQTSGGSYDPDYLVVALGAEYEPEATPGFVEDGYEFYSLQGAERLRDALPSITSGRVLISVLKPPYKCPPAPYEATFLLHDDFVQRGVRDAIDMHFVNPMPAPIPPSPDTSAAILAGFDERGVTYDFGRRIEKLDPSRKVAVYADGEERGYDVFVGIPKHRVPAVVEASGLTKDGADGWIHVDPRNLRTPFDGVYAIGDNADAPVPRAGVFAEAEAAVVAEDIAARIRGDDSDERFLGQGLCYIEFGGGRVARVDVDFLSGPTPKAPFTPPSAELMREKYAYAVDRRARWFS